MFTKKSSLILSAVLATFLTSASFPTMASSEAGLPEKSTLKAGSRWEQMIKKQQEEAAAEAAAKKKAALDREFKSMGKEVPTAKEPPAHKSLTYPQRLEKRNEELRKEKAEKEESMMKEQAKVKAVSPTPIKKPQAKNWAEMHLKQPNSPSQRNTAMKEEQAKETTSHVAPIKPIEPEKELAMKPAEVTTLHAHPVKPTAPSKEPSPAMRKLMEKYPKEEPVKIPETPKMNLKPLEVTPSKEAAQSPRIQKMIKDQAKEEAAVKAPAVVPPVNLKEEKPKLTMKVEEHETVTVAPSVKKPGPDVAALRERQRQAALLKEQNENAAAQQTATKPEVVKATDPKPLDIKKESPTSETAASTEAPQKPAASASVFEELLKKRKRVE